MYCQATAITGMRISGKMSVGVRIAASGPDDQQQQRQHHEGVWPLQRDADDSEHLGQFLSADLSSTNGASRLRAGAV